MEKLGAEMSAENTANVGAENQTQGEQGDWDAVKDVEFSGHKVESSVEPSVEPSVESSVEPDKPELNEQAKLTDKPTKGWAKMTGYYKRNLDQLGDLISEESPEKTQEKIDWYKEHPDKVHELVRDYLEKEKAKSESSSEATSGAIPEAAGAKSDESPEQFVGRLYQETHDSSSNTIIQADDAERPNLVLNVSPVINHNEMPDTDPNTAPDKAPNKVPNKEPSKELSTEASPNFSLVGGTKVVTETSNPNRENFGEIRFLIDPNKPEPSQEDYLIYSVSDTTKEAVPREDLLQFYQHKVEGADTAQKYFEGTRLSMQIAKEYADDPDVMSWLKAVESSPIYQKNRLSAELETARKILERRSADLIRCQTELSKYEHGGILKRLMNRMAKKTAQDQFNWTQRDVDNAKADIERLEGELKELGLGQTEASKAPGERTSEPTSGGEQTTPEPVSTTPELTKPEPASSESAPVVTMPETSAPSPEQKAA